MSLRVIGVDVDEARIELNLSSLHQRHQVAAVGFLYKMHTSKARQTLVLCFLSLMLSQDPPIPACQCHLMLLQYQCPERFPLARHSSTQRSMYGTAFQIRLCWWHHCKWCWTLQEQGAWAFIVLCLRLWPLLSSFLFAENHRLGHGDIYHSAMLPMLVFNIVILHEHLFTYSSYKKKSLQYCCRMCSTFFEIPTKDIDII